MSLDSKCAPDHRVEQMPSTITTDDEGLRCPECEYNLTGLVHDVCPECGQPFDREKLLAELAGVPAAIPIWGQRVENGELSSFVRTILEIWSHPARYARRFPKNPDCDDAANFARWCLIVASGILLIPLISLMPDLPRFVGGLLTCAAMMLTVLMCERAITAVVFVPEFKVTTVGRPKSWYPESLALVRMTRAYLPLSASTTCAAWVANLFMEQNGNVESMSVILLIAVGVYWWVSLALIAGSYRKRSYNLVLGFLLIPLCVVVCTFVNAVMFGIVTSIMCF